MVFDQKAYELKNIELCERYKAGDEDAFVELYKTNLPIFISRLRKKQYHYMMHKTLYKFYLLKFIKI